MAVEIERKFLVDDTHPTIKALGHADGDLITQGYLINTKTLTVRVREYNGARMGVLTIKGRRKGISNSEREWKIPTVIAKFLLRSCKNLIKWRYIIPEANGLKFEVDYFIQFDQWLAEIELPTEDATFEKPEWLGEEVSGQKEYTNAVMIKSL